MNTLFMRASEPCLFSAYFYYSLQYRIFKEVRGAAQRRFRRALRLPEFNATPLRAQQNSAETYFLSPSLGAALVRKAYQKPTTGEVIMLTIMPTETASLDSQWLKT